MEKRNFGIMAVITVAMIGTTYSNAKADELKDLERAQRHELKDEQKDTREFEKLLGVPKWERKLQKEEDKEQRHELKQEQKIDRDLMPSWERHHLDKEIRRGYIPYSDASPVTGGVVLAGWKKEERRELKDEQRATRDMERAMGVPNYIIKEQKREDKIDREILKDEQHGYYRRGGLSLGEASGAPALSATPERSDNGSAPSLDGGVEVLDSAGRTVSGSF